MKLHENHEKHHENMFFARNSTRSSPNRENNHFGIEMLRISSKSLLTGRYNTTSRCWGHGHLRKPPGLALLCANYKMQTPDLGTCPWDGGSLMFNLCFVFWCLSVARCSQCQNLITTAAAALAVQCSQHYHHCSLRCCLQHHCPRGLRQ